MIKNYPITLQIVTIVWGETYIYNYLKYCLKSLELFKSIEGVELLIYTRECDIPLLRNINAKIEIINLNDFIGLSSIEIQAVILAKNSKLGKKTNYTWILPPDTIWSQGAVDKIMSDLKKGIDVSFIHYCRVNDIEFLKDNQLILANQMVDASLLYKMAIPHISQIHHSHSIDAEFSTKWPEYYYKKEGSSQIAKIVAKEPLIYRGGIKLNKYNQIDNLRGLNFRLYGSTSDIFCISLTDKYKDSDWYENYSLLTPTKVANWARKYTLNPYNSEIEKINITWSTNHNPSEKLLDYIDELEKFRFNKDIRNFKRDIIENILDWRTKNLQIINDDFIEFDLINFETLYLEYTKTNINNLFCILLNRDDLMINTSYTNELKFKRLSAIEARIGSFVDDNNGIIYTITNTNTNSDLAFAIMY